MTEGSETEMRSPEPSRQTSEKLKIITDALEDKRANEVEVLDVSKRTMVADYFVVTHSTSSIHLKALADGVIEAMEKLGKQRARREGLNDASWVLLDYGDIVVHIFSEQARGTYDLESLWRSTERHREGGTKKSHES